MSALQWLNSLIQSFGMLFPRMKLVPPTHHGVRFGPKGGAKDVGAGLVFWWPVIHRLKQVPVTTQSIEVSARSMPFEEGDRSRLIVPRVVIVGVAVQFQIVDAVSAAVNVLSVHALVDNRCQAAIGRNWRDLLQARDSVEAAVEELRPWLLEFGVQLERADITHLGTVVGVMQINSWMHSDHENPGYDGAVL